MQVQAVNRRARRKYGEFYGALQMVIESIEHSKKLVENLDERPDGEYSWAAPEKGEVQAAHDKAARSMETMHKSAKKHEAELISRDWRV